MPWNEDGGAAGGDQSLSVVKRIAFFRLCSQRVLGRQESRHGAFHPETARRVCHVRYVDYHHLLDLPARFHRYRGVRHRQIQSLAFLLMSEGPRAALAARGFFCVRRAVRRGAGARPGNAGAPPQGDLSSRSASQSGHGAGAPSGRLRNMFFCGRIEASPLDFWRWTH